MTARFCSRSGPAPSLDVLPPRSLPGSPGQSKSTPGTPAWLTWLDSPPPLTHPQGPWDDTIAGVTGDGASGTQVCNSWVYVVDEVLKPAYDLE